MSISHNLCSARCIGAEAQHRNYRWMQTQNLNGRKVDVSAELSEVPYPSEMTFESPLTDDVQANVVKVRVRLHIIVLKYAMSPMQGQPTVPSCSNPLGIHVVPFAVVFIFFHWRRQRLLLLGQVCTAHRTGGLELEPGSYAFHVKDMVLVAGQLNYKRVFVVEEGDSADRTAVVVLQRFLGYSLNLCVPRFSLVCRPSETPNVLPSK